MKKEGKLILVRHGASVWNEQGIFTGWVDIPLSSKGIQEAIEVGEKISFIPIDVIFVSSLIRAQMTALLAMSVHQGGKVPRLLHEGEGALENWGKIYSVESEKKSIPVIVGWELNERMYGELQGKSKEATKEQFGEEQVHFWRRGFDAIPPGGESLKMTAERSVPYFQKRILPLIQEGKTLFLCAHGNSLRSIVMEIESLSPEEVVNLEIKTGVPFIYNYRHGKLILDGSLSR